MKTLEVPDHLYDALEDVVRTFADRGADYDTADDSWDGKFEFAAEYGLSPWEAARYNVSQKSARLGAMRHRNRSPNNRAYVDSHRDIAVFAVMAYALLLHHNAIAHPGYNPTGGLSGEERYEVVSPPAHPLGGGGGAGTPADGGISHGGPRG